MNTSTIHIFGIRHHGPGSARSLRLALAQLQPDLLLVEGPPDADALLPLLAHPDLKPPVALLVYVADQPRQAVFYPLAQFSPEFQAIGYALEHTIAVRCMDLPQFHQLALEENREQGAENREQRTENREQGAENREQRTENREQGAENREQGAENREQRTENREQGAASGGEDFSASPPPPSASPPPASPAQDPLGALAAAAGYSDGERWWEELVEQRRAADDLFAAVLEAMTALREGETHPVDQREALREAWMRKTIRAAQREGFQRIAIVCGAWHAPALVDLRNAKADEQLLKGLPKLKTVATLAPWSYGRLSFASGYGAGITAPGWYEHLWAMGERQASPTQVTIHWMARVAQLLRDAGMDASAAHVIEAVRLAETLAALRERPLPGLPELEEASQAVFCFGTTAPMDLIQERLIIAERLGRVPDATPAVPLQQDLRREQRRLRLQPSADWRDLELDLRKPNERERSTLLRRLNLLAIPWGQLGASGGKGTFRETWRIAWAPEFDVALIEASMWGTSVAAAAAARTLERAQAEEHLPGLVALVNQALSAELPEALGPLMDRLQAQAACSGDAAELIDALTVEDRQTRSSLIASLRYGSVRELDTSLIAQVIEGMVARICIGLSYACASLDDEAAEAMLGRIMAADAALTTLDQAAQRETWLAALARVAAAPGVHGLVAGRCCRILLDAGQLDADEAVRRMSLALAPAAAPAAAAAWIEGMLRGSGVLLLHDEKLWQLTDSWLSGLDVPAFNAALPLLRRTFAAFAVGERRMLGERAARSPHHAREATARSELDLARGAAALALVERVYCV